METKSLRQTKINLSFLLITVLLLGSQCSTTKKIYKEPVIQDQATIKSVEIKRNLPLRTTDSLAYLIKHNQILQNHFVGFVLHDLDDDKELLSINGGKSFTPASNMKLYTLYAALHYLDDKVTALEYRTSGDSLIVRATGDPSFLDPYQEGNETAYKFLSETDKDIYLDLSLFQDECYGEGWAWDDFPYYYQAEKSAFPIYANKFYLRKETYDSSLNILPAYFSKYLKVSSDSLAPSIDRSANENFFTINEEKIKAKKIYRDMPFAGSHDIIKELISDTLNKEVVIINEPTGSQDFRSLEGIATDSLYQELMIISDNFIAEQLLLMCSHQQLGYMKTKDIITLAKEDLLNELPDEIRWVDGSGLSRYNLVTPQNNVWILKKLLDHWDLNKIKNFFPSGKGNDTLNESFQYQKPWIFAKTGSLSNNFNLSGYLITQSEKVLVFSFMNNHFLNKRSTVIEEMHNILSFVRENY